MSVFSRRDLIQPSLDRSGQPDGFAGLVADVKAGRSLYFEGRNAVLVPQVINDHEGLSLNLWIVGGELLEGLRILEGLEAFGRGLGCGFISFSGGRKGWGRLLKPLGYAWNGSEFRKAL